MSDLLPTVPGYVTGVVNLDPPRLQCGDCGATIDGTSTLARLIIQALEAHGWRFCRRCSDPRMGAFVRRCGDCADTHEKDHA